MSIISRIEGKSQSMVLALCLMAMAVVPVGAEAFDLNAVGDQDGLAGYYYPNLNLAGSPTLVRVDSGIDFDWGGAAPAVGFPEDDFSVRWIGVVTPDHSDLTQLYVRCDDGVRVYLDDHLVIDDWGRAGTRLLASPTLELVAGRPYRLVVEYFEVGSNALIELGWRDPPHGREIIPAARLGGPSGIAAAAAFGQAVPAGGGLVGGYFANRSLSDPVSLVRRDTTIDFGWKGNSPAATIPSDDFSVRWLGTLTADETDSYELIAHTDDGVRVWLDGELVIDHWKARSAADSFSAPIDLAAGEARALQVDYYERGGQATARLSWRRAPGHERVIPGRSLRPLRHLVPATSATSPAFVEGVELGDLGTRLEVDGSARRAAPARADGLVC